LPTKQMYSEDLSIRPPSERTKKVVLIHREFIEKDRPPLNCNKLLVAKNWWFLKCTSLDIVGS